MGRLRDFCLSCGIFVVGWFPLGKSLSDYMVRPRVKCDVHGKTVWSRLLVCQLVMVRTLSGGELGILLGGSTIRSSAGRELVMEICGANT